jgi:hypothetical protein
MTEISEQNKSLAERLSDLQRQEKELSIEKQLLIKSGLESSNPSDILKASEIVQSIQTKSAINKKTTLVDPLTFTSNFGYKDKPYALTYGTLSAMSKTPIINAIIKTRKNQVAAFCESQSDKYTTGFVVRKRNRTGNDAKMSLSEHKRADKITESILNCGWSNKWGADDFDAMIRKLVQDSYSFDQYCFEVIEDRRGFPQEMIAVDAATVRISESYDDEAFQEEIERRRRMITTKGDLMGVKKFGYYPSYVQVIDNVIQTEYYPWELCFGVRNPTSSIYSNGYGVSELEELMVVITSILWGDEYNRRFFSQGSSPKGLLKIKGGVSEPVLQEFKQSWAAMMAGVQNSWKTPVLDGDVDWIDLHKSNSDMEYGKWQEYLIKISCAVMSIDPAEVNFPLGGGSNDSNPLFGGSNENRLKFSKEKGLYPMLRHLQRRLDKYWVKRIDPEFEFVFVGMDALTKNEELEMDIKLANNLNTIDEVRERRGDKPMKDGKGDYIGSGTYLQNQTLKQQADMMSQQESGISNEEENQEEDENPFIKSTIEYLNGLK